MKNRPAHSRAFTLVELMISLGIALLLIYGINLVFRAVTDTVRTGNALAVATRKMRTVDSSLTIDFEGTYNDINPTQPNPAAVVQPDVENRWSGIVPVTGFIQSNTPFPAYEEQPRQPAITIYCKRVAAFLNKDDETRNAGNPANQIDEAEDGTFSRDMNVGEANRSQINTRIHRLDTIGFFSGGTFAPRASRGAGVTSGYAAQAWVWYGHTLQYERAAEPQIDQLRNLKSTTADPTNGRFVQPGVKPSDTPNNLNANNYYASDWVLGRTAMLLVPRKFDDATHPGYPVLGFPNGQITNPVFTQSVANPTGIGFGEVQKYGRNETSSFNNGSATKESIPADAEVVPPTDKDAVTMTSAINDKVAVWLGEAANRAILPSGKSGTNQITPYGGTPAARLDSFRGLLRSYQKYQFDRSAGTLNNPTLTAAGADWWCASMLEHTATGVPVLNTPLRFNTVNAFSRPVDPQSNSLLGFGGKAGLQSTYLAKGCTQFVVEFAGDFCTQSANGGVSNPTVGDGTLDLTVGGTGTQWYGLPRDTDGDGTADVLPVNVFTGSPHPFEKVGPTSAQPDRDEYVVAFGPNELYPQGKLPAESIKPWLIRITVTVTDPDGNLADGLTREFIFKVR